jgi:hypothetical protein
MKIDKQTRDTIRAEARRLKQGYRITAAGEVHFYGPMVNGNTVGWWLFAQEVPEALRRIEEDKIGREERATWR